MKETIEAIENDYKISFTMFAEGYKFREMAQILQLNIEIVKRRFFFARKQLYAQLKYEPKITAF
ncbi:MAG TPA: hypothetical protein DER09_08465 [Prolixibacteraceae bacterium]|nr:hypothetical protein [Prolixibacteraceae bacterium]